MTFQSQTIHESRATSTFTFTASCNALSFPGRAHHNMTVPGLFFIRINEI
jgi:hypothetical protein